MAEELGRDPNEPFGGISVILVGDFGQVPPIKDGSVLGTGEGKRSAKAKFLIAYNMYLLLLFLPLF